jgi:hypothetical protein
MTITAAIIIDLTDLNRWTDDAEARARLASIGTVPRGSDVVIRAGAFMPFYDMLAGSRIDHVNLKVEADDADKACRWIAALRELEPA